MLKHIPSDITFENRKQAKKCMGRYKFCMEMKRGNFVFYNEDETPEE